MKALRIHLEGTVWLITLRGRQIIIYHTTLRTKVSGTAERRKTAITHNWFEICPYGQLFFFILSLDQGSTLHCCVRILIINNGLSGPQRKSKEPTTEKSTLNSKNLLQTHENLA